MSTESHRVTLPLSGRLEVGETLEITVDAQTNLLKLMHDAGLSVRKACRNGGCGVCRCQLVSGQITYHQREPFALWEQEKKDGYILPCIAFAVSSVTVDQLSFETKK